METLFSEPYLNLALQDVWMAFGSLYMVVLPKESGGWGNGSRVGGTF